MAGAGLDREAEARGVWGGGVSVWGGVRVCEGRARGRRHIVVKPTRQPLARMRVRVRVVWVRGVVMIWAQSVRGGGVQ